MNYNPFKKGAMVHKGFHRYPSGLSMFDRIVGRAEQMGILDYALALIPFFIKLGMHKSKNKSTALHVIFAALSVPFSITKLGIFIGTAPLSLVAWGIKKGVQRGKLHRKISPYTAELNTLMVRGAGKSELVPLADLKKFHDGQLLKFSIKVNELGEIVILRFPKMKLFATIEPSRENIVKLQRLFDPAKQNRVEYFLSNVGKNIIDYDARTHINAVSDQQARDRVKSMYELLVKGDVADESIKDKSLVAVPKDVRDLIAVRVLRAEANDSASKHGYFASFKPKEREDAIYAFVNKDPDIRTGRRAT